MSRPVVNERHDARPLEVQPYTEQTLGTIDPSGYTASDAHFDPTQYGYGPNEPSPGGAIGGSAGACSTESGLGMGAGQLAGLYVGAVHANPAAPIEYQNDGDESGMEGRTPPAERTGVSAEHALSKLRRFVGPIANDYGETY